MLPLVLTNFQLTRQVRADKSFGCDFGETFKMHPIKTSEFVSTTLLGTVTREQSTSKHWTYPNHSPSTRKKIKRKKKKVTEAGCAVIPCHKSI